MFHFKRSKKQDFRAKMLGKGLLVIIWSDLFSPPGFYELSDGASNSLSNSSHSVFSECFCSPAEAEGHFLSTGTFCFLTRSGSAAGHVVQTVEQGRI